MKYLVSLLLLSLLCLSDIHSQIYRDPYEGAALSGVIRERGTYIPVAWARIRVKGTKIDTTANARGFFVINGVGGEEGGVPLIITHDDYETLEVPAVIGGIEEMGVIFMDRKRRDINPVTVNDLRYSGSEVAGETFSEPGTQAIIFNDEDALLWANRYSLGALGFRPRGYDWQYTDTYFNGVNINDPQTGYASAMLWNGFSDIVLSKSRGYLGLNANQSSHFGGLMGVSDISIRPAQFRKQGKLRYGYGNSLSTHEVGAMYASGETRTSEWSMVAAISGRTGEGFADGMKYENASYLFSVEHLLTPYHFLWFTVMGAPTKRNVQNFADQEIYDIADNNYYNSNWGQYNGKDRAVRQHRSHTPIATLNHLWDVNDYTTLRSALGVSYATNSVTDIGWTSDAANPWPNADANIPDYFTEEANRQFNWDTLYSINRLEADTSGLFPAKYHLGQQYNNNLTVSLSSVYDTYVWENLTATAGVNGKYFRGSFYNKMNDLLGADYWTDVDKFTVDDADRVPADFYQNNINDPDRQITLDDKFGYDYNISQYSFDAWTRWTLGWRRWSFTGSALAGYTSFSHKSNMPNGKFADADVSSTSKGFVNLAVKGRAMYPFSRFTYAEATGLYQIRPAQFRDAYLAPELSGELVPDLKAEKIMGADASFVHATGFLDVKVNGFFTYFTDQTRTRRRYIDDFQSKYALSLSGLKQMHFGGELATNVRLIDGLTIKGAFAYGIYKYASNPLATFYKYNTAEVVSQAKIKMNKQNVPNVPQMAGTAGILYDAPLGFWVGCNFSYIGSRYAESNPFGNYTIESTGLPGIWPNPGEKHAENGYLGFTELPENADNTSQTKLDGGTTLDVYGGYLLQFGKHYISMNVNIQNILDNQKIQIGGYERWRRLGERATSPDLLYAYGRTISLRVSYHF